RVFDENRIATRALVRVFDEDRTAERPDLEFLRLVAVPNRLAAHALDFELELGGRVRLWVERMGRRQTQQESGARGDHRDETGRGSGHGVLHLATEAPARTTSCGARSCGQVVLILVGEGHLRVQASWTNKPCRSDNFRTIRGRRAAGVDRAWRSRGAR